MKPAAAAVRATRRARNFADDGRRRRRRWTRIPAASERAIRIILAESNALVIEHAISQSRQRWPRHERDVALLPFRSLSEELKVPLTLLSLSLARPWRGVTSLLLSNVRFCLTLSNASRFAARIETSWKKSRMSQRSINDLRIRCVTIGLIPLSHADHCEKVSRRAIFLFSSLSLVRCSSFINDDLIDATLQSPRIHIIAVESIYRRLRNRPFPRSWSRTRFMRRESNQHPSRCSGRARDCNIVCQGRRVPHKVTCDPWSRWLSKFRPRRRRAPSQSEFARFFGPEERKTDTEREGGDLWLAFFGWMEEAAAPYKAKWDSTFSRNAPRYLRNRSATIHPSNGIC